MTYADFKTKGDHGYHIAPTLTLSKSGGTFVNGAAFALLGRPDKVVLAFDADNKKLGMRVASDDDAAFAYRITNTGKTRWISTAALLRANDYPRPVKTVRLLAAMDGSYLSVKLP